MEYTREEIIKIGEKEIDNSKKLWRSFAIIALVAFLIGLAVLITFLILKELTDETSITAFVVFEIHTLGFTIFAFLYSYQKQYDRFESGRRSLESKYKGKLMPKVEYTTDPQPIFKETALYDCFVIQKTEVKNNNNNNINRTSHRKSRRQRAEELGWDEEEMDLVEFEELYED